MGSLGYWVCAIVQESRCGIGRQRLEAFSDGVLAIVLTIMVLEMKAPAGSEWASLRGVLPAFSSYVLSFAYVGIYWNNHHHLLHTAKRVDGAVLLANLHLLFWLSLIPFTTAWMGQNRFESTPVALYGCVLLMAGFAYAILVRTLLCLHGPESTLARAVGSDVKSNVSLAAYAIAIPAAFVYRWLAIGLFVAVAVLWFVPDRRIERTLEQERTGD